MPNSSGCVPKLPPYNSFRESTLFVFLRPVIVDDDKFRDLLYLTALDARKAKDGHNYPASSPLLMGEEPKE